MKKIAVYAICKNEIKHIQQWLEATKEADYTIVLDTGSTDGTWEILQKARNIICMQKSIEPWRFDVGRNAALDLVPDDCDICLPLDIDMIPRAGFCDIIRKNWSDTIAILSLRQLYINTGKIGIWIAHSRKDIVWKYPVFEQVIILNNKKIRSILDIIIDHDWIYKQNHEIYLPLVELSIKENPGDLYPLKCKKEILANLEKILS